MKLSTKGRYGLKAIVYIGNSKTNVSIREIAQNQQISEGYLEQIIAKFKKSNLVKSTRGATGGYCLSKSPDDISVGDILRSVEGDIRPITDCGGIKNGTKVCTTSDKCVTKYVWQRINDSIDKTVDEIKLSELISM